jgi:WD40 repeat protein
MSNEVNVMQIPGYYYDPVKKKYFKVMSTGPYSRQNYQKAQTDQHEQGKKPAPKRFARITPLSSYCRMREVQTRTPIVKSISNGYIGLLATLGKPQKVAILGTAALTATATARPTALEIHPTKNHLLLGLANGTNAQAQFSISWPHGFQQQALTLSPHGSEITCISMGSYNRGAVCTMGNGRTPPNLAFIYVDLPEEYDDTNYLRPGETLNFSGFPAWGSFWCCDQSKVDESRAVLGTDNHAVYFKDCKPSAYYFTDSAVLTAQIDPVQPNLFLGGCRDGRIKLFDARVDRRKVDARRGHSPYMIRHKSPITHLHKLGSSFHIVAAGMDGSLQTWDMRGHTNAHTNYQQRQSPVFRFNGHKNVHTRSLGFDVLNDAHVVAVAGDDHVIRLWSLKGDSTDPFHAIPMTAPIPALKFCANSGPYQTRDRSLGMLACTDEQDSPLQWLSVGASM